MKPNTNKDFWRRVKVQGHDECWPWVGYVPPADPRYGVMRFSVLSKQPILSHRLAWALTKGHGSLPPQGVHIHHTCENPICVNPAHLEALMADDHRRYHKGSGCRCPCDACRDCHHKHAQEASSEA